MVKDKNDKEIKAGQIVLCVEPIEGFLENKEYVVLDTLEASGRIVINPDGRGQEGHYKSTRFIIQQK